MMLTIHGLPISTKYHDLRMLIKKLCNIDDFILDNLVGDVDGFKKVRIGVANESEGEHLMKCLENHRIGANVLRVLPVGKATSNPMQNVDQRGGFHPRNVNVSNAPGNYNAQPMAPLGNRPAQWPNAAVQSNQWSQNSPVQSQIPQNNYGYQSFPPQQSGPLQRQEPRSFGQREEFTRPQDHSFGYAPKANAPTPTAPLQAQRRQDSRTHVLRSVEIIPSPLRPPAPSNYPLEQNYDQNKPMTIKKDFFQGTNQFVGAPANQPGYPQGQGPPGSWNQSKPAPFGKHSHIDDRKYPSTDKRPSGKDYDKGQFLPHGPDSPRGRRSSPHGRRVSPHGGRTSPHARRVSPHGGRVSPHGGRVSPHVRRVSPHGGRVSPHARRVSPHGGRVSPHVRRVSPHGGRIPPHGGRVSPNGRRVSPSGRRISPSVRRISPPGRRISPSGRRMSPHGMGGPPHEMGPQGRMPDRRISPGRRMSPGRRVSPSDRRMAGPLRKQSPPGRRESPPRHRFSPSRRHPDKEFGADGRPSVKQVRPAYEPDVKAPNQAMYSGGGYRPNPHENAPYPMSGPRQMDQHNSSWQQDRDKVMYPGAMKKDDERREGRMPMVARGPELIMEKRSSPMHKSRSPTRRDGRERSPLRDRYRRHSPSPPSPRRSWALEKRRSPEMHDAPPPPIWPGQQNPDDYSRPNRPDFSERPEKFDKNKQVPVWDNRAFEGPDADIRHNRRPEDIRPYEEPMRMPRDIGPREPIPSGRRDPSPRGHGFKPRDARFSPKDHREPKFEPRDPKFDRREPQFETRGPPFEPRDHKFPPRDPKFEPRDRKFEEPKFESRNPKFEPRDPKFEPREPKFEPREPKFEPREPKFEPREPKFEPRGPKFEPRDPKFDPREPKFEARVPKFEPRDPKFEPRDPKFEPRDEFKDRRDFRRDMVPERKHFTEREPFNDFQGLENRDDRHRGELRREDFRKDDRKRPDHFDKEFEDIYKRAVEFKQRVEDLRKPERSRETYDDSRRREPDREDRRKNFDERERQHEPREGRRRNPDGDLHTHEERPKSSHQSDDHIKHRAPEWKLQEKSAKKLHLDYSVKVKRDKAVEEICNKMMHKYGDDDMKEELKNRVREELNLAISRIFFDMFGDRDVSFIELVVKFNSKHNTRDEIKIFKEVMSCLPTQDRIMKRPASESTSDVPAKNSRRSLDPEVKKDVPELNNHVATIPDWNFAFGQQNFMPMSIPQMEGIQQVSMMMSQNPMMVPNPFVAPNLFAASVQEQFIPEPSVEDGFNLYLCKDDFKPFTDTHAEYLKQFLVCKVFQGTESSQGWAPNFTLKGLQSMFRYEVHTYDEKSKDWLMNLDFSEFELFSVLVYSKEELWYERAAIWLPGHSRCRNIEPLDKLKLQNKKLDGVNIGKWKLVKKIVNTKGTRVYVDMPPSSARALEAHKMMLSYELQKVSVFLKAVAVDKDAFDSGLQERSVTDPAEIMTAVQNSPMASLKEDPNIVKISLKGSKSLSIGQVRKIKEMIIYRLFKYHEQNGGSRTDFVKYGFCSPNAFGVLPENSDSKRWLTSLDIGRLNKQPIIILGGTESDLRYIKLTLTVPGGYHWSPALVSERLKQSNQGVKGINFSLWKPMTLIANRHKVKFAVEVDLESAEMIYKMKFQLDYVDDRHNVGFARFSPESSESQFLEQIQKYKDELTDSYDVANMDIDSQSEDDDIICLGEVNY